jgi:S1-C subfamily serine protease/peptidoglycan hydrolase-like protein with peptidoglycan-binding domain
MLRNLFSVILAFTLFCCGGTAIAQQNIWIQIEAKRSQTQTETRLQEYYGQIGPLSGYRLRSGWHAVVLGPFDPNEAQSELARLRAERQIPGDSFIADGSQFAERFWPEGTPELTQDVARPSLPKPQSSDNTAQLIAAPEETLAESRRAERTLTREERELVQTALQWEGFYSARIDGDFGPGTRRSMNDYQLAKAYEATGVLSTQQRDELISTYRETLAAVGLRVVLNEEAGIEMKIPAARVSFSRFEAPFVHFDPVETGSGYKVLLISQKGDRGTLTGLFEVMQSLEIVPLTGKREKSRDSFVLTGQNAKLQSYTYAQHKNGIIKGFTLAWPPEDAATMARIAEVMRASFKPIGDAALDESLGGAPEETGIDLLAGLEIRKPIRARSGFFIDEKGTVLTTHEAVAGCTRVTIADEFEAEVRFSDEALGIAVLAPKTSLAPAVSASFLDASPRLRSDVAVAGFSYEGALGAPTLTFGTLSDSRGLKGEEEVQRLAMLVEPGDTGGPVLDSAGSVLGVLLPRVSGTGKQLPENVQFAAKAEAIATRLDAAGVSVARNSAGAALPSESLTTLAGDMTVLVSCWR